MKMDELINGFSAQIERAIEIGEGAKLTPHPLAIHNVLVTGLGGSGIGGSIVAELYRDELKVPIQVNKEYSLPQYVDENTLVIVSSYSGNTEETYLAMQAAFKKDAKIICITSGGKIKEFAECNGLDYILIDGGMPPRACFAYSFVQQLYVLNAMNLIGDGFKTDLKNSIELLKENQDAIKIEASEVANKLIDKIPIIYTEACMEGVAIRFRQQINENSKMLCWHHVIPEMNHNELVGWRSHNNDLAVVALRTETEFDRNRHRIEFVKEVASSYTDTIIDLFAKGNSGIERALYTIHLTDWISFELSVLGNHDAVEVDIIMKLKDKLSNLPL